MNIALLIDADNTPASAIAALLARAQKSGNVCIRLAYGDWTRQQMSGWKKVLHQQAIQPVQQFAYCPGKNATDLALVIDAMDLLHTTNVDGFCLVSSDSDFTRLAMRLRESGKCVHGFGQRQTPAAFVSACTTFTCIEDLLPVPVNDTPARPATVALKVVEGAKRPAVDLQALLTKIITRLSGDDGWVDSGKVASAVHRELPGFKPRLWGAGKFSLLLEQQGHLECRRVRRSRHSGVQIEVRLRPGVLTTVSGKA
ncbi:NYN domain-containing protein [Paraburkholderia tropica]|uniref:NYN domain-containing protein n=1 Tax=Paraburkholderia tropica TaxID=92647 RepID=UPI002AB7D195|nr:NYN domain-containing protein [Paraburkholderia tropica]